jgi:hypothetical protein
MLRRTLAVVIALLLGFLSANVNVERPTTRSIDKAAQTERHGTNVLAARS